MAVLNTALQVPGYDLEALNFSSSPCRSWHMKIVLRRTWLSFWSGGRTD